MKSKEEIYAARTGRVWVDEGAMAAMQEYADQQTAAATADIQKLVDEVVKYRMERDEYRRALEIILANSFDVHLIEQTIRNITDKYPQQ